METMKRTVGEVLQAQGGSLTEAQQRVHEANESVRAVRLRVQALRGGPPPPLDLSAGLYTTTTASSSSTATATSGQRPGSAGAPNEASDTEPMTPPMLHMDVAARVGAGGALAAEAGPGFGGWPPPSSSSPHSMSSPLFDDSTATSLFR